MHERDLMGTQAAQPKGGPILWFVFYTPQYFSEALECQASFKAHGLDTILSEYADEGEWMRNCLSRSRRLLDAIHCYHRPVGMMDADLRCHADPRLIRDMRPGADMLVRDLGSGAPDGARYLAGLVAFAPTRAGGTTLATWADLCRKDPRPTAGLREQLYLLTAIDMAHPSVVRLPRGYNSIPDKDGRHLEQPLVVGHDFRRKREQPAPPPVPETTRPVGPNGETVDDWIDAPAPIPPKPPKKDRRRRSP